MRRAAQLAAFACVITTVLCAHDLERTQVTITFARDGSFVVDVANDLEWLKLRLPTFAPAGPKGPALRSPGEQAGPRGGALRSPDAPAGPKGAALRSPDAQADPKRPALRSPGVQAGPNGAALRPGDAPAGSRVASVRPTDAVDLAALSTMFIDRVVLFVDGHEVRPTSAEYIPPRPAAAAQPSGGKSNAPPTGANANPLERANANPQSVAANPQSVAADPQSALHGATSLDELPVGTYRLRGRMPIDAKTLRWYYGLVLDPYSLTVHRADGRTTTEVVSGDAWSRTIDIGGQFKRTTDYWLWIVVALFAVALGVRIAFGVRRPGPFGPGARRP